MQKVFWKYTAGLVVLALVGAVALPYFARARECCEHRPSCQSNLKQIGLASALYMQENDSHFPPVALAGNGVFGWADALQPHVKSATTLQCPDEVSIIQSDPRQRYYTDYWMNSRLSGISEKSLAAPTLTILNGEGNTGTDVTDARYSLSHLPHSWIAHKNSPIHGHLGGSNYAFVDGHVKWFKPEKIKAAIAEGAPTFSTR